MGKMISFKKAVETTPEISHCYQPGLRALGSDSEKVQPTSPRRCNGSVDLDVCVRGNYPVDNRWDYILSYENKVYFIEVHPAQTGEVGCILSKLQWLKKWLSNKAPLITERKAANPFYWVASGKVNILKTSNQYKKVAQAGILPVSRLRLA